jgi:hypothetical protein
MTLFCEKDIVAKFKEMESGCNLAEFSKGGCGSRRIFTDDDDDDFTLNTVAM